MAIQKAPSASVVLRYLTDRLRERVRHKLLVRKWSHHADPRTFDWDWKAKSYNRVALVNLLLSKFPNPTYLEIGCGSNTLFNSVPVADKTGVDPRKGGNVRKTSDEFFRTNRRKFDVIFIDGLHTYDQVRRDVVNAMGCLNKGGWITLHDMLPSNWIEHHVPKISRGDWTGDVWKVAFELAGTEGVDFRILKIDYGVGVFRLLRENVTLKNMTAELTDKEFDFYYDNIKRQVPLVEWSDARDWLHSEAITTAGSAPTALKIASVSGSSK